MIQITRNLFHSTLFFSFILVAIWPLPAASSEFPDRIQVFFSFQDLIFRIHPAEPAQKPTKYDVADRAAKTAKVAGSIQWFPNRPSLALALEF